MGDNSFFDENANGIVSSQGRSVTEEQLQQILNSIASISDQVKSFAKRLNNIEEQQRNYYSSSDSSKKRKHDLNRGKAHSSSDSEGNPSPFVNLIPDSVINVDIAEWNTLLNNINWFDLATQTWNDCKNIRFIYDRNFLFTNL